MEDLIYVLKKSMERTNKSVKSNPLSLLIPIALVIAFTFINTLALNVLSYTMLTGFLLALVYAVLLSVGMHLYFYLIQYNKLDLKGIADSWRPFFLPVYGTFFLLMLVKILIQPMGMMFPFMLVFYLFLNPLPETIYMKSLNGMNLIKYSFEFQRENLFYWTLPLLIYLGLNVLALGLNQTISGIAATDIINQMSGLTKDISLGVPILLIRNLISLVFTGYYMIFRGHLFTILSASSKRKRKFMGDMYE